jgi:hypothetical protein
LIILISVNCGRLLQSASKENDACSSIKPTNKSDCFNSVGNTGNGKCCAISFFNTIGCKSIDIDSIAKKTLSNFGGEDKMNVYLSTNVMGNAEVMCSDKNPISEDFKTLANNCGNNKTPSLTGCNALSNENVQCCFTSSSVKVLGDSNLEGCAGIISPVKLPAFSMNLDASKSSFLCGVNSDEVETFDSCAAVTPNSEADCSKMSKGEVKCRFASFDKKDKKVKICLATKGDIEMMMNLGIEPRLREVNLNSLSDENGLDRVKVSLTFIMLMILFEILI